MSRKLIILLIVILSFINSLMAQENVDVKSGVFEGRVEVEPEKRRSRYEDVRKNRKNRNPRDNVVRESVDTALDLTIKRKTAGSLKHGMDAIWNINEAIAIKNKRLKQSDKKLPTSDDKSGERERW